MTGPPVLPDRHLRARPRRAIAVSGSARGSVSTGSPSVTDAASSSGSAGYWMGGNDDPLVLDVTASMLEDIGCEVVTARGGKDALEKLSTDQRVEILITDINMLGMDGYALADAAKRMRQQLKVILLSGQEREGGGFPLIRKPFLSEDLRRTMAEHTGLC